MCQHFPQECILIQPVVIAKYRKQVNVSGRFCYIFYTHAQGPVIIYREGGYNMVGGGGGDKSSFTPTKSGVRKSCTQAEGRGGGGDKRFGVI